MRLIDADALTEVLNVKKNCEDCDYQQGMFCSKSSDFVNACEAIFDAPTIEPEPHWIPCKPINQYYIRELDDCKDKPYLVTYETKTGRRYVTKVNIYNGFVQRKENRIIAWMPLPTPYQEDADA